MEPSLPWVLAFNIIFIVPSNFIHTHTAHLLLTSPGSFYFPPLLGRT